MKFFQDANRNFVSSFFSFSFTRLDIFNETEIFLCGGKLCESAQIDSSSSYLQLSYLGTEPCEINRQFSGVGTVRISFLLGIGSCFVGVGIL